MKKIHKKGFLTIKVKSSSVAGGKTHKKGEINIQNSGTILCSLLIYLIFDYYPVFVV